MQYGHLPPAQHGGVVIETNIGLTYEAVFEDRVVTLYLIHSTRNFDLAGAAGNITYKLFQSPAGRRFDLVSLGKDEMRATIIDAPFASGDLVSFIIQPRGHAKIEIDGDRAVGPGSVISGRLISPWLIQTHYLLTSSQCASINTASVEQVLVRSLEQESVRRRENLAARPHRTQRLDHRHQVIQGFKWITASSRRHVSDTAIGGKRLLVIGRYAHFRISSSNASRLKSRKYSRTSYTSLRTAVALRADVQVSLRLTCRSADPRFRERPCNFAKKSSAKNSEKYL